MSEKIIESIKAGKFDHKELANLYVNAERLGRREVLPVAKEALLASVVIDAVEPWETWQATQARLTEVPAPAAVAPSMERRISPEAWRNIKTLSPLGPLSPQPVIRPVVVLITGSQRTASTGWIKGATPSASGRNGRKRGLPV